MRASLPPQARFAYTAAMDHLRQFNPLAWLRNSFVAGIALVLPFVVTIWLIWQVVNLIDQNVVPLVPGRLQPIADAYPGAGLLIAVAALTLVGALAGNLVGRWLVAAVDGFIANLPVVRSIYGGAKQVFKQVAAPERNSFKQAVLVEFPKPGVWAIGFVTNEDTAEVAHDIGDPLVAVYVPHAPLPTSGFLLYLSRSELRPLRLRPEEALKRVLSLGLIREEGSDPATRS